MLLGWGHVVKPEQGRGQDGLKNKAGTFYYYYYYQLYSDQQHVLQPLIYPDTRQRLMMFTMNTNDADTHFIDIISRRYHWIYANG